MNADLRVATRSIRRQPAVFLPVVLVLALSIAAIAALFAVTDTLYVRPLPYADADRIVHLDLDSDAVASTDGQARSDLARRVAATTSFVLRGDAGPRSLFDVAGPASTWGLRTHYISASMFPLLGQAPLIGRVFNERDREDTPFVVLLAHEIWVGRFGGDASIVGRSISIPGTSPLDRWRVVGVMPPGFSFPRGANFWIPDYAFFAGPPIPQYAKLARSVSLEAVRAEFPELSITKLGEHERPEGAEALGVALAAATLMLAVAWLQIATLLLTKMVAATPELGLRLALGARRSHIVVAPVLEGLVLIALAWALAMAMTPPLIRAMELVLPPDIVAGQTIALDSRSVLFACAVSLLGVLFFGVVPLALLRQVSPIGLLRGGAMLSSVHRPERLRRWMLFGQLAATACVVYLSALLIHSYVSIRTLDLGFDANGLFAIQMPGPVAPIAAGEKVDRTSALAVQRAQVSRTIDQIGKLPGVIAVSGAHSWPLQVAGLRAASISSSLDVSGARQDVQWANIVADYPRVLGLTLLAGSEPPPEVLRALEPPPQEQLALVNAALADSLEALGPVLGQVVSITPALRFRIVGVVENAALDRPTARPSPGLFTYLAPPSAPSVVLFRAAPGRRADELGVSVALQRIWGEGAPRVREVTEAVDSATSPERARTLVITLVSLVTLPLAAVGVAGAVGYATRTRRREMAIRQAVGASRARLRASFVSRALGLAGASVVVGITLGWILSRAAASVLFGISAVDFLSVCATTVVVLAVVAFSALVPTVHATGRDLVGALKEP